MGCKLSGRQYVGNTISRFRSRMNKYDSDVRKAESDNMENVKLKYLQSYFLQKDDQGFLKDVDVRLIDKTQASDPT